MTSQTPPLIEQPDPAIALLLPGMSLNATIFPDLGIPTVRPDLTDHDLGDNGITDGFRALGWGTFTQIVERELSNTSGWNSARRIVVAHSLGGMLALEWLLRRQSSGLARIDGLVLVATTAGPMFRRVRIRIGSLGGWEKRVGVGWLLPVWNQRHVTKLMKRFLCRGRWEPADVDYQTLDIKTDRDLGLAGWCNTDWRAIRSYRHAMRGFDVRDRLCELNVPTVVLHGTEDSLFESQDAQELHRLIPNSTLRLVPGAGHALPVTHGEEIVRAVRALLPA